MIADFKYYTYKFVFWPTKRGLGVAALSVNHTGVMTANKTTYYTARRAFIAAFVYEENR